MQRVVLESPYAGDVKINTLYARRCMKDCLERGEAPYASHLLFTQEGILDDNKPDERKRGIEAGFLWGQLADKVVVYTDLGVSSGMKLGIERAQKAKQFIEFREFGTGGLSTDPSQTMAISNPDILGGEIVFSETRLSIQYVFCLIDMGLINEVTTDYPYLSSAQIQFVYHYYGKSYEKIFIDKQSTKKWYEPIIHLFK